MRKLDTVKELVKKEGFLKSLSIVSKHICLTLYGKIAFREPYQPPSDNNQYNEIRKLSGDDTDISDHLTFMFEESLRNNPSTIVELGVRGGVSSAVFRRVSEICGSDLISVDLQDCSDALDYEDWYFIQRDDLEFAGEFKEWSQENGLKDEVDILFIDTSHEHEHTKEEIESWFPHLASNGIVFFHDTNLSGFYFREDGSVGKAWDNDRGVIGAIEELIGCSLDEKKRFSTIKSGFLIRHNPYCNGMTMLKKLDCVDI
ncbi:MAG: class I SAM-dependent methyltransferase [Candidatus Magasanikbacteria bacterium]